MNSEARELPEVGVTIGEGRFELLAKLGEGGMSGVFHAQDHHLDREVALKLLLPRYLGRPAREQRIINEAAYLRRVQGHPNIVELYDSGRLSDQGWPWLSTELLRGEVLDWLLVRSKLEAARVIDIARQVAAALMACHERGVVHRDTTPGNLFVLEDGTVKLFDFSHAGDLRGPQLVAGAPGRLTGVHDAPGTLGYMGPEQAAKAPADPSMDVFAFGTLLFELITRRNPFRQFADRDEFIRAQREGTVEVPKLHAWAYEVPEELAALVGECTVRAVDQRPSMSEVVGRLAAIAEPERVVGPAANSAPISKPESPAKPDSPGPTTRRGAALFAVGLLVVVAGGGGILLTRDSPSVSSETEPAPTTDAQTGDGTRVGEDLPRDPEPKLEAQMRPEPEPEPEHHIPRPKAAPAPDVIPAPASDPACDGVEARGRKAFEQRKWRAVIEHTARKACWPKKDARALLRTTALFNLGRWDECARVGATSHDPKVRSMAEACEATAKLDAPESK